MLSGHFTPSKVILFRTIVGTPRELLVPIFAMIICGIVKLKYSTSCLFILVSCSNNISILLVQRYRCSSCILGVMREVILFVVVKGINCCECYKVMVSI